MRAKPTTMIQKHSSFISMLTVALLLWTLAAPQARSAEEDPALRQAQALMAEGNNAEALELLDGVILAGKNDPERAPLVAEAHYLKAKIYFAAMDTDRVEKELTWVYVVYPEFERAESDVEFKIYMAEAKNRVYSRTAATYVEKPARSRRSVHLAQKKKFPLLIVLAIAVAAGAAAFLLLRPKKEEPAPEGEALITLIESVPSGATVYIDTVVAGTTPLSNVTIKAGYRTIRLADSTYGAAYKNITIQKDYKYRFKGVLSPFGYRSWTSWGSRGTGPGQFLSPQGCAIADNFIYVCDSDPSASRIQKFNTSGNYQGQWQTKSPSPVGIAADKNGHLYVTTSGGVEKYTTDGAFIGSFAADLRQAQGIMVSPAGDSVIVAEASSIRKYSLDGALLRSLSQGYGASMNPRGLVMDSGGNLYASICPASAAERVRIHKFNPAGVLAASWEMQSSGNGLRGSPLLFPLLINGRNDLLFGDSGTQQVVLCRTDGTLQGRVIGNLILTAPLELKGMAQNADGYIFLSCSSADNAKIIMCYPNTEPADSGQWEVEEQAGFRAIDRAALPASGQRRTAAAIDKRQQR